MRIEYNVMYTLNLTRKDTGNLGKKAFDCTNRNPIFLILHARYNILHLHKKEKKQNQLLYCNFTVTQSIYSSQKG